MECGCGTSVRSRLEDDPNDAHGFVIKTVSGKDFNINALSPKEKEDWMVQIRAVKRCFDAPARRVPHRAQELQGGAATETV